MASFVQFDFSIVFVYNKRINSNFEWNEERLSTLISSSLHYLMRHHAVCTEKVGAVKAARHCAGLPGLAAGAVGSLQLGVRYP